MSSPVVVSDGTLCCRLFDSLKRGRGGVILSARADAEDQRTRRAQASAEFSFPCSNTYPWWIDVM